MFMFQKVPFGVLCFLPSYKLMETLTNRWKVCLSITLFAISTSEFYYVILVMFTSLFFCLYYPCALSVVFLLQQTGLWGRLEGLKVVMKEPRASEKADFDQLMKNFYEVIEMSVAEPGNINFKIYCITC